MYNEKARPFVPGSQQHEISAPLTHPMQQHGPAHPIQGYPAQQMYSNCVMQPPIYMHDPSMVSYQMPQQLSYSHDFHQGLPPVNYQMPHQHVYPQQVLMNTLPYGNQDFSGMPPVNYQMPQQPMYLPQVAINVPPYGNQQGYDNQSHGNVSYSKTTQLNYPPPSVQGSQGNKPPNSQKWKGAQVQGQQSNHNAKNQQAAAPNRTNLAVINSKASKSSHPNRGGKHGKFDREASNKQSHGVNKSDGQAANKSMSRAFKKLDSVGTKQTDEEVLKKSGEVPVNTVEQEDAKKPDEDPPKKNDELPDVGSLQIKDDDKPEKVEPSKDEPPKEEEKPKEEDKPKEVEPPEEVEWVLVEKGKKKALVKTDLPIPPPYHK